MGSADMRQHIRKIELIGKDPEDGDISIYLFEVRSVTAKLRHDIARRFRERPENALLVLTQDYEELEFVLLECVMSRSQCRRAALKQAIRPIPLTVHRLHPNPVALRVLKRFTFTEEDTAYRCLILDKNYLLKFVIAILNSALLSYFHIRSSAIALRDDFPKIVLAETRRLPISIVNFTTPAEERGRLTQEAISAYDIGDNAGMLRRVQQHIDSDKTDVVHDLLAHLAQCMIDLNKQKHAEIKRFLA
jgi:hypothetical protein